MKALVKSKAEPGLWLEEVPEPTITINDVLIRIKRTGICGTDVHIWNWDKWAQSTISVPTILGHELVGEIVEIGSNVNDFAVGDIVSVEDTSSAAAAGIAWLDGDSNVPTPSDLVSTRTADLQNISPFR